MSFFEICDCFVNCPKPNKNTQKIENPNSKPVHNQSPTHVSGWATWTGFLFAQLFFNRCSAPLRSEKEQRAGKQGGVERGEKAGD
jgi:hypothetical protein